MPYEDGAFLGPAPAPVPLLIDPSEIRVLECGPFGGLIKTFDKVIILIIFTLVLILAIKYRRRILFLLTGDDMIRLDIFSCCHNPCIDSCCCCHANWPARYIGRFFGVWPHVVQFENFAIGNIPCSEGGFFGLGTKTADLFIELEQGINPTMQTRVQQGSDGTIAHFGDSFSINIHDSMLEGDIKIKVMDQDVVGHDEVCFINLEPKTVIRLASEKPHVPLRFQLKKSGGSGAKKRDKPKMDEEPWVAFSLSLEDTFNNSQTLLRTQNAYKAHPLVDETGKIIHPGSSQFHPSARPGAE
jgi:hypothetical protein